MRDPLYATLAIVAFIGALVLLARVVSLATAMVNLGIVVLLAVVLALQSALDSPAIAYAALVLAAVSFVLRWAVNGGIWVRDRRRARARDIGRRPTPP